MCHRLPVWVPRWVCFSTSVSSSWTSRRMGILSSFAWRCNDPLRWFCENKGKKIEQRGKNNWIYTWAWTDWAWQWFIIIDPLRSLIGLTDYWPSHPLSICPTQSRASDIKSGSRPFRSIDARQPWKPSLACTSLGSSLYISLATPPIYKLPVRTWEIWQYWPLVDIKNIIKYFGWLFKLRLKWTCQALVTVAWFILFKWKSTWG